MAEPHIISGLRLKRAEISGYIADLERKINHQRATWGTLTRPFGFSRRKPILEAIPPKRAYRRTRYFTRNELSRLTSNKLGYRFVPLTTTNMSLIAAIEILFLRPYAPGSVIKSGDIDNRLKTLFDALEMAINKDDLGGYSPAADENPFFVLLEDDNLISHVAVETDVLLQPTLSANGNFLA